MEPPTFDEVGCWSTWAQTPTFTNFLHVTMITLQVKKNTQRSKDISLAKPNPLTQILTHIP